MRRLDALGGYGRFPHKMHNQIMQLFRVEDFDSLVRVVRPPCTVSHIIYPHEMFALIARKFPYAFGVHLGASQTEKLLAFWTSFLRTPYGQCHPHLTGKTAQQLQYCLPLILHGDACPYAHRSSALFVQWGSLIGMHRYCRIASRSNACARCLAVLRRAVW